jgi:hypothetical protein
LIAKIIFGSMCIGGIGMIVLGIFLLFSKGRPEKIYYSEEEMEYHNDEDKYYP